jgi:hypothetical protein
MPLKDMATTTGAFGFIRYRIIISLMGPRSLDTRYRTMGGTVGISIGQVIFANVRISPRSIAKSLLTSLIQDPSKKYFQDLRLDVEHVVFWAQ